MLSRAFQYAPITVPEFAQMLRQCIPPVGWPKNIGIANSGGPDSTCLLFLLNRHLSLENRRGEPQRAFSLTVDHDLQPSSEAMARQCATTAEKLGIEHVTSKVAWSQPPFPPRPLAGQPLEADARVARYRALFDAMTEKEINVIAFGHHLDDQVETSLMRLAMGSTKLGARGMRPCRRWGMGAPTASGSEFGYKGMERWIVRPLLDIGKVRFKMSETINRGLIVVKERILATCEANNLEYVTDPTNFQPALTLRNAIRHEIHATPQTRHQMPSSSLPQDIVEKLMNLEIRARALPNVSMSLESSIDELREGVRVLNQQAQDIEDQVDIALRSCSLPSIPGAFVFSARALQKFTNPDVQRSIVLRIMRYVSPHPWGSFKADAGRRKGSIETVTKEIFSLIHEGRRYHPFSSGGGVLWSPAIIRDVRVKIPEVVINKLLLKDDFIGWIASRQPPLHREKMEQRGWRNTLEINLGKELAQAYQSWRSGGPAIFSTLYDERYLLKFHLDKMPEDIISFLVNDITKSWNYLLVLSYSRWYRPKVVIQRYGNRQTIHDLIYKPPISTLFPFPKLYYPGELEEEIDSGWIKMEWIRPLTAL
ncbi:hypothetical protein H0H92_000126 [Tricholoma furcatifolium]|nr:hypothetical protein H0H92_000126 [Tricholoma furcatifolium]